MIQLDLTKYKHITTNSKNVIKNSIFVSINNNDEYINEAINNGAALIVSENKIKSNFANLLVKNILYFFSYWYQKINDFNMNDFIIIGVTGTDGKTTTSKMIYDTIKERYRALCMGTLGINYDNNMINTINTTPDIEIILDAFKTAKKENIKYIIMEASSEGLLSKRLTGIKFDVVIFTNLSHEHQNTHISMENYFNCKKKILKIVKNNGIVISNLDCEYGNKFKGNKNINYSLHKGKVKVLTFTLEKDCTKIFLMNNKKTYYYKIPFVGIHNIYNFLATHAAINHLFNIKLFTFKNLTPVDGRFCVIDENIIIDFAHTPNALENLLLTVKQIYKDKRILLLLGAQGEKDKTKRKILGSVADKYADIIILTSEDPKNESLIQIIFDISLGVIKAEYLIELSRKKAIEKILKLRTNDDVVLIVGKGFENKENINNILYSHSDYECVQYFLSEK